MQSRSTFFVISRVVVISLFFQGSACRDASNDARQVTQKRSLEVQLKELSSLVSKSSGIDQNFEHHVSWHCRLIANDSPESLVHVFGLTESNGFIFEMRELRGVQFLADYQPSDATAARIPNPIKDPGRYALVALRNTYVVPNQIDDLTDLAVLAEQPLTPRGHHDELGPGLSPRRQAADFLGLSYLILDRQSQRDKEGNLRFDDVPENHEACLYVVEFADEVHFQYGACLTQYLIKKVSRQDLLNQVHRSPIVRHDSTSTYRSRVRVLNRLFRKRKDTDLMLSSQALRFEGGVWRVFGQGYTAHNSDQETHIELERINNKMVITEVF